MVAVLPRPYPVAAAVEGVRPSTLRSIMARASQPGVRSFAIGMPDTRLLPHDDLQRAAGDLLGEGPSVLQYSMPSAFLKEEIVRLMALRGVVCRPEEILLCAGGQQAMTLVTRLLLDPGGEVMVEEIVYDGMLKVLEPYHPTILTIPTDTTGGIDVQAVEARLVQGARPAFLYLIPDGHNPLGVSLSTEKRRRLVQLARRWAIPIVEDDAYGHLRFGGAVTPPLRALEEEWVFHIGSFSKVLSPSLRVGWIVAPEALIPQLAALKHAADLDVAPLGHQIAARYLQRSDFRGHLERTSEAYRARRNALLHGLRRHFRGPLRGARWNDPEGGIFVWLELPEGYNTTSLLARAIDEQRVSFTPGAAFAASDEPRVQRQTERCLRLCFATQEPEQIDDGVRRLARALVPQTL